MVFTQYSYNTQRMSMDDEECVFDLACLILIMLLFCVYIPFDLTDHACFPSQRSVAIFVFGSHTMKKTHLDRGMANDLDLFAPELSSSSCLTSGSKPDQSGPANRRFVCCWLLQIPEIHYHLICCGRYSSQAYKVFGALE